MRKSKIVILSFLLALSLVGCQKKEVVNDVEKSTEDINNVISNLSEATPSDSELETNVAEETVFGGIVVSDEESRAIDDIIVELKDDVEKEPIDPGIFSAGDVDATVDKEQEYKDELANDWKSEVRESLGVPSNELESDDDINKDKKGQSYDSDGDPRTREIESFDKQEEEEVVLNSDGAEIETVKDKIEKAKEKTSYKGIQVVENNGDSMKLGKVYNYFVNNGTEFGSVGEYIMCGQLGITLSPALVSTDATISSNNNKVIVHTGIGDVEITRLKEDFNVEKMSASQIQSLSGIAVENTFANATRGSYGAYSMLMVDKYAKNAVQYYSCTFGTYEFKYLTDISQMVYNLFMHVYPSSELNEVFDAN